MRFFRLKLILQYFFKYLFKNLYNMLVSLILLLKYWYLIRHYSIYLVFVFDQLAFFLGIFTVC